jgi:hypothetical protein
MPNAGAIAPGSSRWLGFVFGGTQGGTLEAALTGALVGALLVLVPIR